MMSVITYHEVDPADVDAILLNGLKRSSRGEKGDDQLITKTDEFLDSRCPHRLKQAGLSRDNNLYAYVVLQDKVLRITDGRAVDAAQFIAESDQAVLRIEADPERCYVSDLEAYDAVKEMIDDGTAGQQLDKLALNYWAAIAPLSHYDFVSIRRPEVMITYDIPSDKLQLVSH